MSAGRRVLAAAAVVMGVLAVAPPAAAAEPTVEWTRPSLEEHVLEEPGPITGTITGGEDQTIENLRWGLEPQVPAGDPCFVDVPGSTLVLDGNRTEDFQLDLDLPCNRAYELEITVGYEEPVIGAVDVVPTSATTTASIDFSVAIPPAEVTGFEAAYDEATREVRLSWAPNPEPDLLGYIVERNPPGPDGFTRLTPDLLGPDQTTYTDPGIEEEHRYRVMAVRSGAESDIELSGEPTTALTAGPERPEPTLPDNIPAPNSSPPTTRRTSGGGGGGSDRPSVSVPSRTRTTSTIFEETLPFDPSQTTTIPGSPVEPPEDAAVLAEFDDGPTPEDRRATLVPIAGGLALVVGAMHLFLLSKRAGEADIPMSPRSGPDDFSNF